MTPEEIHRSAAEALTSAGLQRQGRSRWLSRSDEIVWVAELDRGASWSPWSVVFGGVVRAWSPDLTAPHANFGHVSASYATAVAGVPPSASSFRFDDHQSYFTAAFRHDHDLMPHEERLIAFGFMSRDLAGIFGRLQTLDALAVAVRAGQLHGFVHRRLREAGDIATST